MSAKKTILILSLILFITNICATAEANTLGESTSPYITNAKVRITQQEEQDSNVITFSEFPLGTYITNQYSNRGVIFGGDSPFISTDEANPTSPVLSGSPRFQGVIEGRFVNPNDGITPITVSSFSLDAGYFDDIGSTRIEWFDRYDNKLGEQINSALGIEHFNIEGSNIARWRIAIIGSEPAGFAIDNIGAIYGPQPPPSPPIGNMILTKTDDVNNGDYVWPGREIIYTIDYNYPCQPDTYPIIDFEYLANLAQWWLTTDCNLSNNNCNGTDMDIDGIVNFYDFALLADSWGRCLNASVVDVNITDYLPAEVEYVSSDPCGLYDSNSRTVTWSIGTVHPGDFNSVTLKVNVGCASPPGSTITNHCKMTGNCIHDVNAYENTPVCPNYPTLTKTDDVNGYVYPGKDITYRICYDANGYGDTNVVIDDNLPPEVEFISASDGGSYNPASHTVTWDINTLEPNESGCITLTVKVGCAAPPGSIIINHCQMTGNCIHDINTYENTPVCPNYPTLTKIDDINGSVVSNDNITYNICYAANGYRDTNVKITDQLPPEVDFVSASDGGSYNPASRTVTWNIGTLEPNASGCFTLQVKVNQEAEQGSTIRNCSQMTGDCIYASDCERVVVSAAAETINVDLNAYGDANDYTGEGAYDTGEAIYDDGFSRWLVYYGGWGKPIGSPKSSNLHDWNEPNYPGLTQQSTPWAPGLYGAQVWIGDRSLNHTSYRDTNYPSPGLLNDGFIKTGGVGTPDPNICLFGDNRPFGAFGGSYDIYVYGSRPTHYTLKKINAAFLGFEPNIPGKNIHISDPNSYRPKFQETLVTIAEANVTGGFGDFGQGKNYTVFQAVDINAFDANETVISNDGNDVNMVTTAVSDPNSHFVYISYSNVINGLQLVSRKRPVQITNSGLGTGTYIPAGRWNSASDNPRIINVLYEGQYGFASTYGPSVADSFDSNYPGPHVGLLNKEYHWGPYELPRGEFMQYDISVNNENQGRYAIALVVSPYTGDSTSDATYDFYYDGTFLSKSTRPPTGTTDSVRTQTAPTIVNLFTGLHSFKWELAADTNAGGDNILEVNFVYVGPVDINAMPDYNAVVRYDDFNEPNKRYPREVKADNPVVYLRFDGDVGTEAIRHQYRYFYYDALNPDQYYDFNYPPVVVYGSQASTVEEGGIGNSAYLDNTRHAIQTGTSGLQVGTNGHVAVSNISGTDSGSGTLSYDDVGFRPKPGPGIDANKSSYDVNLAFTPGDVTYEIWVRRPLPGQPRDPYPWRRLASNGEPCTADTNNYNYYSTIFQQMRIEVDPNIDQNYPANSYPPHAGPALSLMEGNDVNGTPLGNIRVACGAQWWYPGVFLPNDGQWHQLVVCYDVNDVCGVTYNNKGKPIGDTNVMKVKLYMDGTLAASADVNDPCNLGRCRLGPWLNHCLIGAGNQRGLGQDGFAGSIDEFAIYPYILDPNRVKVHYDVWQSR